MSNVKPISLDGVTPEVVAEHVASDAAEMDSVYVIAFSKDGQVMKYFSGSASEMAFAALIMQEHALAACRI